MFVLSNISVGILIFLHIQCPVLVKSCQSVCSTIQVTSLKQQDTNLFIHGLFYRISPHVVFVESRKCFHSSVTRIFSICYSYGGYIYVAYCILLVCCLYVTCMLLVCHSYGTRIFLIFYSYVTCKSLVYYSYVACMLYYMYVTRV